MKRKFSFSPKGQARRSAGQTIAASVMALAIAVSGVGTTALYVSQPSGLAVEPTSAQQYSAEKPDKKAAPEEEKKAQTDNGQSSAGSAKEAEQTVTAAVTTAGESAAESEPASAAVPQPATEQTVPAAETPAATGSGSSGKLDMTGGDIEEENAKVGRFVPETPELAAEDPLAAPAAAGEASDAAERAAQAMEETPMLLTPEQVEQALDEGALSTAAEGQEADLSSENCLAWLWQWLFGSGSAAKYSGWRTDSSGNTYYYDQNTHEALTGIHTIDGVLYYFNADGVKQDVTFGIDVSKYQTNIDWQKVKTSGVEFVIIRVGYRGYTSGTLVQDPMFEEHYTNASNAGLRIGVYAFSQAVNENEAREEAQACVYVLNGRRLDYPIYFDTEASGASDGAGRADGLSAADRTKCAVAFCEEVKALGYQPGVYASTRWFNKRLDMSQLSGYSIWNAHYNVAQSGVNCDLWQGTCEGKVNGYSGGIDVNVSFVG